MDNRAWRRGSDSEDGIERRRRCLALGALSSVPRCRSLDVRSKRILTEVAIIPTILHAQKCGV